MAALTTPHPTACDRSGACQGRTIPCLTCTAATAEQWPAAEDTCTLQEWATGPLLAAALLGLAGGFVYGVLRHFGIVN